MQLRWFRDFNLPDTLDDELVLHFCQEHRYILLTGNRSTKDGTDSLEYKIRHLATSDCVPVVTIGNLKRVNTNRTYREQCAERLAEIVADLHTFIGVQRLFNP